MNHTYKLATDEELLATLIKDHGEYKIISLHTCGVLIEFIKSKQQAIVNSRLARIVLAEAKKK